MDKLIIEVAVNETVSRGENPHVPITCPPDQLDIGRLGDVASYKETILLMKDRCDVIPYPTYPYLPLLRNGSRSGPGDLPLWDGVPLSNAEMVERFARMARDVGRDVASAAEARSILGIRP